MNEKQMRIYIWTIYCVVLLKFCHGLDLHKTTTKSPLITSSNSDLFSKRELNLKVEDNLPKSYEPPSHYYRGPGSSSSPPSSYSDRNHNKERHTENNVIGLQQYPFENRILQPPKGGISNSGIRKTDVHDGIGHYGQSSSSYVGNQIPYGHPQPIEFSTGYGHTAGYEEYDEHRAGHGIGYDLYNKWHGDYGPHHYNYPTIPGHDYYTDKIKFTKSFLVPLAGAAIIGLAAALIANPLLLQVGTVSGALGKRRRKRNSLNSGSKRVIEDESDNKHHLVYNAYRLIN